MTQNSGVKFEIHYYLKDNSHAMNAFVRNKVEKDFLEAVKRIGELLDSELQIETEAYQEGGLIEILAFSGVILTFLAPSINDIITHYARRKLGRMAMAHDRTNNFDFIVTSSPKNSTDYNGPKTIHHSYFDTTD